MRPRRSTGARWQPAVPEPALRARVSASLLQAESPGPAHRPRPGAEIDCSRVVSGAQGGGAPGRSRRPPARDPGRFEQAARPTALPGASAHSISVRVCMCAVARHSHPWHTVHLCAVAGNDIVCRMYWGKGMRYIAHKTVWARAGSSPHRMNRGPGRSSGIQRTVAGKVDRVRTAYVSSKLSPNALHKRLEYTRISGKWQYTITCINAFHSINVYCSSSCRRLSPVVRKAASGARLLILISGFAQRWKQNDIADRLLV